MSVAAKRQRKAAWSMQSFFRKRIDQIATLHNAGQPDLPENYSGVGQSLPLVVAEQQLGGIWETQSYFRISRDEMRRSR